MRGILRVYMLGLRGLEVGRWCGNAVHREALLLFTGKPFCGSLAFFDGIRRQPR